MKIYFFFKRFYKKIALILACLLFILAVTFPLKNLVRDVIKKRERANRLNALQKAVTENPKSATVYTEIGKFFINEKNYEIALRYLKKALEISITDIEKSNTYLEIGKIYRFQKNEKEAIRNLKNSLRIKNFAMSFHPHYPLFIFVILIHKLNFFNIILIHHWYFCF